ncbi:MAG: 3-hydroxyacyl-ACP dehydratase FabZ [Acidobacteriota bacterium]
MTDNATSEAAGDDYLFSGDGPWDVRWIRKILPHRYPFLLVDRVLEIERSKRIVAVKNVTVNEPFFNGHFPNHPVMPGVLIVEGMAQAGGILLMANFRDRESKLIYFMGIDKARFRRPIVPGDTVRFEIDVLRLRESYAKIAAKAIVDGELAAEATLSSGIVDSTGIEI